MIFSAKTVFGALVTGIIQTKVRVKVTDSLIRIVMKRTYGSIPR